MQDVLLWDPEVQEQKPPDGRCSQQRERHVIFYLCIWKFCMGDTECFRCMLGGHILYGYFVLLMVKWKRKYKSGKEYFHVLQGASVF